MKPELSSYNFKNNTLFGLLFLASDARALHSNGVTTGNNLAPSVLKLNRALNQKVQYHEHVFKSKTTSFRNLPDPFEQAV